MELTNYTASELARFLQTGQISSSDIVSAYLDRIDRYNLPLNVFTSWDREVAMQSAAESDSRRRNGAPFSAWDGIPIALKDILCTKHLPTTCGSRYLKTFVAPYNASVVERLSAAGLILLGKTNLDEFAMGGSTETSIFGSTRNPWDRQKTAGGSSGGSAAAVAARLSPLALGTDTGGSIRLPAAYCGICGLKPTYGRISRYGLVAFASSLDQIGPMAHSIEDLTNLLSLITGHCSQDSTSLPLPPIDASSILHSPVEFSSLRLGVVREQIDDPGLDAEVRAAIMQQLDEWQNRGATIEWLSMPAARYGISAYYVIAPCEASSNLSRFDGAHYGFRAPTGSTSASSPLNQMYADSRSQGFGSEVKRRLMLGTYALSAGYYDAYYKKALQVRRLISLEYQASLEKVDVIIGPTAPSTAFGLGEKQNDPVQMYLVDLYTVGANLAGLPALSMPIGLSSAGLPIGLQLQAAPLGEDKLLRTAMAIHQAMHYQPLTPPEQHWKCEDPS